MRLVSWIWFLYFLLGLFAGGGLMWLWFFFNEKAVKFKWYEWVLAILIFLMYIFLGQTFIGSYDEGAIQAAWMSALFFGLPMIIMGVVFFRSIQSRVKTN